MRCQFPGSQSSDVGGKLNKIWQTLLLSLQSGLSCTELKQGLFTFCTSAVIPGSSFPLISNQLYGGEFVTIIGTRSYLY